MIARMKKYSFLVYHREYAAFLEEVRKLGVLDVVEYEPVLNDRISENLRLKSQLVEITRALEKRKQNPAGTLAHDGDLRLIIEDYRQLVAEEESLRQKMTMLDKNLRDVEVWGDFSPELIHQLHKNGISVHLYTCPASRIKPEWTENHFVEVINELNAQVYFAVIAVGEDLSDIDADPVVLPAHSPSQMRNLHAEYGQRLADCEQRLDSMAKNDLAFLKSNIIKLDSDNHYETVILNTRKEAGEKLLIMQGFAPEEKKQALDTYLEKSGIVYFEGDPEPGDKVPVILKNNRFARLFEPIAKIYMLPDYRELDLTPYFAPFYMLFFGFCFGDVGYSLLYLTILFIALRIIKNEMFKSLIYLGMFLSLGGVIFGILGGTFFGMSVGDMQVPFLTEFMKNKGIHFLTIRESMILSFILGGIQLMFGMILKAINLKRLGGTKAAIPMIGWFIVAVSSVVNGLLGIIYKLPFSNTTYWIFFGVGMFMIFFLNSPGKNPFVNFGAGLWDAYNMAVGVTGDLLSYVRLFALGMAGGMLGSSFNNIGSICMNIPWVGWLLALVVLIAGHGINIFMSTIGSFVHPLRLTFVEFYKNAGFSGGGKTYKPFKI